jgi:hypothetical protein
MAMRRTAARVTGLLVVACAGAAIAGEDGPPLAPPADVPPLSEAVEPAPESIPNIPPRPAYVVPRLRPSRIPIPTFEPSRPEEDDVPPLVGPDGMSEADPMPAYGPGPGLGRGQRPITLESVPEDALPDVTKPGPRPTPRVTERLEPSEPVAAPPRRFRLFNRFELPSPPPRPREQPRPDSAISVEPRSDPAADAALKRRLERQVREIGGDRLRSLEVRVVNRNVAIRARANHFWQRRGLRRSIESLPGLSGYRTSIDVDD